MKSCELCGADLPDDQDLELCPECAADDYEEYVGPLHNGLTQDEWDDMPHDEWDEDPFEDED
jgi:hypothetical protein